jgi:hypothetical protein
LLIAFSSSMMRIVVLLFIIVTSVQGECEAE